MKKLALILSGAVFLASCGNSSDSGTKTEPKDTATATPAAPAASEKGLELIGASDCTTCHKLDKGSSSGATIGPAYSEVAAKYAPAADSTVDRLVKKIITGGQGVWGTVPMTPHPALAEADVREMVHYILSLKK